MCAPGPCIVKQVTCTWRNLLERYIQASGIVPSTTDAQGYCLQRLPLFVLLETSQYLKACSGVCSVQHGVTANMNDDADKFVLKDRMMQQSNKASVDSV